MSSNSIKDEFKVGTDENLSRNKIPCINEKITNNKQKNTNLNNRYNGSDINNNKSNNFEYTHQTDMIKSFYKDFSKHENDDKKKKTDNSKINSNNESNIVNYKSQNNNNNYNNSNYNNYNNSNYNNYNNSNYNNYNNNNYNNYNNNNNNYNKSQNQIINSNNNQNFEIKNGKTQKENEYPFGKNIVDGKTCLKPFGDTSYLNSVLQCLGNFDELKNHLLYNINYFSTDINVQKKPISYVFCRLFKHLSENDVKLYDLEAFRKALSYKNVAFKSQKRRNPIELLNFLLDTLHDELNRLKNRKQNNNFDISDRRSVIENGIIFFKNSYDSVISNNLNWFRIRESRCLQCNRFSYNLSTFNTYELDILETPKNSYSNITVYDCLNFDLVKKFIDCHCIYCNQKTQMESSSSIYSSPNIFIFLINRNRSILSSNCNDFDDQLLNVNFILNMKICLQGIIQNNNCPKTYELFGIVSIYKNEYKYVSFCKSSDNWWYLYHDDTVEKIEEKNVEFYHQNNTFIPCILFYKKIVSTYN